METFVPKIAIPTVKCLNRAFFRYFRLSFGNINFKADQFLSIAQEETPARLHFEPIAKWNHDLGRLYFLFASKPKPSPTEKDFSEFRLDQPLAFALNRRIQARNQFHSTNDSKPGCLSSFLMQEGRRSEYLEKRLYDFDLRPSF